MRKPACWILLLASMSLAACSRSYVITTDLSAALEPSATYSVGTIVSALPANTEGDRGPTHEAITKLKSCLIEEIGNRDDLPLREMRGGRPAFVVRGRLLEYEPGSGTLRFLVGWGAGQAKLVVQLRLVSRSNGRVRFAGKFVAYTSGPLDSGDEVFRQVARNFSKQLEQQHLRLQGSR